MGNKRNEIHLKSNKIPKARHGTVSINNKSDGLKANKVMMRKKVKMKK